MLEYVYDLPRFMSWLHARVADHGRLIATYFNHAHVHRRVLRLLGGSPSMHPDWRNALARRDLLKIIMRAGFDLDRVIPTHHSWRPSPSVEATEKLPTHIHPWHPWSPWLAHQFIVLARPV